MSLMEIFKYTIYGKDIENADDIVKELGEFVNKLEEKQEISDFTDLQKEAFGSKTFWSEDKNAIILGSTSSGKTLAAELNMALQVYGRKRNVIYLVPLRALTTEKMADFKSHFDDLRIYSSSSDYQEYDYELSQGDYDIGVLVYEKFFALYSQHQSKILNNCGLIVVDEMHMISDSERGPKLEFALERMRYSEENPPAILGLSTTECDMQLVRKWLGEEKTDIISNDNRPVEIEERFLFCTNKDDLLLKKFNNGQEQTGTASFVFNEQTNASHNSDIKINMLLQIIRNHPNKKIIVFCPKKRYSEIIANNIINSGIVEQLTEENVELPDSDMCDMDQRNYEQFKKLLGYGVAYHNAGLTLVARDFIEKSFRNGNINIIIATDTLTVGINLPTDVMVIYKYTDHEDKEISYMKYKNIIGRAGRLGKSRCGYSYVLCSDDRDLNKAVNLYSTPRKLLKVCSGISLSEENYAENVTPYFLNVLGGRTEFEKKDIKNIISKGLHESDISPEAADEKAEEIIKYLLGEVNPLYVKLAIKTDAPFSTDDKYAALDFGECMAPFALKLQTCSLISKAFVNSESKFKMHAIPDSIKEAFSVSEQDAEAGTALDALSALEAYDFCTDNRSSKCFLLNMLYSVCYLAQEISKKKYLDITDSDVITDIRNHLAEFLNKHKEKLYTETGLFDRFFKADDIKKERLALYRAVVLYFWLLGTDAASIRKDKLELPDSEEYYIYTSEVKNLGEVCAYIFEAISQAFKNDGKKRLGDKFYDISICLKYGMNRNLARIANKHIPELSRTRLLNIEKYALKKDYKGFMDYIRNGEDAMKRLGETPYKKLREQIDRLEKMDAKKMYERLKMEGKVDSDFTVHYVSVEAMSKNSIKNLRSLLLEMGIRSTCKPEKSIVHIDTENCGGFEILLRTDEKYAPNEETKTLVVYNRNGLRGEDSENCRYIQLASEFLKPILVSVSDTDKITDSGELLLEKLMELFTKSGCLPEREKNPPKADEKAKISGAALDEKSIARPENLNGTYIGNLTVAGNIIIGDNIHAESITAENTQNNVYSVQINQYQYNQWIKNISELKKDGITEEDEAEFFEEAEKCIEIPENSEDDMKKAADKLLQDCKSAYSLEDVLAYAVKLDGTETRILKALYVESIFRDLNLTDDCSPSGVLYGRAVEVYAKNTALPALKAYCPNVKINNRLLTDYSKAITIGNISHMIDEDLNGEKVNKTRKTAYGGLLNLDSDAKFWNGLKDDMEAATDLRNNCCHAQPFNSNDAQKLREKTFDVMKKISGSEKLLSYLKGGSK